MGIQKLPAEPETVITSKEVVNRIEASARRLFRDENDRDECFLFILEGLKQNNYRRLASYKGESGFYTYLYTCINSLAYDFLRSKFGRKRVPKAVSRLGRWAEEVYKLVCWRRHTFDQAYDIVVTAELFEGSLGDFLSRAEPIKDAPCHGNPRFVSSVDQEGREVDHEDTATDNPLKALLGKLDQARRIKAVQVVQETLDRLSEEDRLLFTQVYVADQTAVSVARVLGLTQVQASRRLKRIRTLLKEKLLALGVREP